MNKLLAVSLLVVCTLAAKNHQETIPAGSAIYIDSSNGFDIFITAAFQAKHVPLRIVSSPDKADYILNGDVFHIREFMATSNAARTGRTSEAAVKLTSKSGEIVWAYAVTKGY